MDTAREKSRWVNRIAMAFPGGMDPLRGEAGRQIFLLLSSPFAKNLEFGQGVHIDYYPVMELTFISRQDSSAVL